jgi:hypothetical protein
MTIGNCKRVAGVVLLCLATVTCGGSSPTAPSASTGGASSTSGTTTGATGGTQATACRTGPGTYRIVTTGGGVTSTINGTCTYDNNAVAGTCTNLYSDTTGQAFTSVSTTRHPTRGDVVDEVSVIPPLQRALGTTTTLTGSALNSTGTSTLTYDAQKRLISAVATTISAGQSVTSTTTYTAWDSAGRPTVASSSGSGTTYTYDNATRTQLTTTAGVSCSQVFDTNGNPTVGICSNGATSTLTMLSTLQVCR